ncbi:MAG: DUF434 domain-containing protein [Saprospiraceae bacterium]|nr:DUF434 domain-containing protein [Saprospiraceae bacterium]
MRSRNYAENAALKVVGDRYQLKKRQRYALNRIVSADADLQLLQSNIVSKEEVRNTPIYLDGFNVLILAEVLHSRGLIFECVDGTYRDIASVHGSYHPVEETTQAIMSIGQSIVSLHPSKVEWYLDAPVSNSGRLKELILEIASLQKWNWEVILVPNPDVVLTGLKEGIVVSSDRAILSSCEKWFNFSRYFVNSNSINSQYVITFEKLGLVRTNFKN